MRPWRFWLLALLLAGCGGATHAHLLGAERGTLNLTASGAYLALSLPAEAVDASRAAAGLRLVQAGQTRPLEGLLLQRHEDQVLVLGRFDAPPEGGELRLQMDPALLARPVEIVVSRDHQTQWLRLDAAHPEAQLLPSVPQQLWQSAQLGAAHILQGADHLIFLLLVLAAGLRWPMLMATLTAFTLGHAVTLGLAVWAGVSVSPRWVEPAIAATLIAMAAFDRRQPGAARTRLALVFACALIHGLGLAEALQGLPLDTAGRLWALVGFNSGIEAAQVAVAILALAVVKASGLQERLRRWAWPLGLVTGSFWLVQRLAQS